MKRTMFITGAAKGTGFTVAKRFAREGWNIALTSRNQEGAEKAAAEIAAEFGVFAKGYELGVGNEQRVIDIFNDLDSLDCFVETVVFCAADLGYGTDPAVGLDPLTVRIDDFRQVLETNNVWDFMIARQAALRMKEHHKGSLVFIASNTAYRAIPNRTAYCASKGGMLAMSRALAVDLGKYGIRSNCILPGTIKTLRWINMGTKQISNGELAPIGDIADFDDIANACYFLGTDMSKVITGSEIEVDGGMSCQLYPIVLNDLKRRALEGKL